MGLNLRTGQVVAVTNSDPKSLTKIKTKQHHTLAPTQTVNAHITPTQPNVSLGHRVTPLPPPPSRGLLVRSLLLGEQMWKGTTEEGKQSTPNSHAPSTDDVTVAAATAVAQEADQQAIMMGAARLRRPFQLLPSRVHLLQAYAGFSMLYTNVFHHPIQAYFLTNAIDEQHQTSSESTIDSSVDVKQQQPQSQPQSSTSLPAIPIPIPMRSEVHCQHLPSNNVHCFSNGALNDESWPKVRRMRAELDRICKQSKWNQGGSRSPADVSTFSQSEIQTMTEELLQQLTQLLCDASDADPPCQPAGSSSSSTSPPCHCGCHTRSHLPLPCRTIYIPPPPRSHMRCSPQQPMRMPIHGDDVCSSCLDSCAPLLYSYPRMITRQQSILLASPHLPSVVYFYRDLDQHHDIKHEWMRFDVPTHNG